MSRWLKIIKPFTSVKIYNLKLPKFSGKVTLSDLRMLTLFLNFVPSKINLKCDIQRYDKYDEYVENIFLWIYCEATEKNWLELGTDMLEFSSFLSIEKTYDKDLSAFLNLVDVEKECDTLTKIYIQEKIISYINYIKRDYQPLCQITDKLYIKLGSSVNDSKIIWGNSSYLSCVIESHG